MMDMPDWIELFPGAVTVCDTQGVILLMNRKAIKNFQSDGGKDLIGKNALDCHPAASQSKFKQLLENQQINMYTIQKNGIQKMIYQAPWFGANGRYGGIVELSLEMPAEMPNFNRGG